MKDETREKLRELLASATRTPWRWENNEHEPENSHVWSAPDARSVLSEMYHGGGTHGLKVSRYDAELIVAAVNALPDLLDRIDTLESAVQSARNEALKLPTEEYYDAWLDSIPDEMAAYPISFECFMAGAQATIKFNEHIRALKTDGTK